MAKRKRPEPPPGSAAVKDLSPVAAVEQAIQPTLEVSRSTLSVTVPYLQGVEGYCKRRVDVGLTATQAKKLKGIMQGLEQVEATLENGRTVSTPLHAIQWMIENAG